DLAENLRLQDFPLDVGNDLCPNLPTVAVQQSHNNRFGLPMLCALHLEPSSAVHFLRLRSDVGFVHFDRSTSHLFRWDFAKGKADTMEQEPCGFLCHSRAAVNLPAAHPVLTVGNHPHCHEPLV